MTDYDKLTQLFESLNIPYKVAKGKEDVSGIFVFVGGFVGDVYEGVCWEFIHKFEGDGSTVEGYPGFYSYYKFDENGKFDCIGIYE